MKTISLYLILCTMSFAGSHGRYELSCTSASLRTHLHLTLNDEDFEKTYYPQAIALSVMGNMESMHDDTTMELSNYITNSKTNYYNARKIINGHDKALTIEKYAKEFEKCLRVKKCQK